MARYIEQGKSIFIPFKNGVSITDSQLHLRMYKTVEMFKRHFPENTKYDVLCEYAPVVRCKDCIHFEPEKALRPGGIWCTYWGTDPDPEDFCCKGERKNDE